MKALSIACAQREHNSTIRSKNIENRISFAQGLKDFFTVGLLVTKCRISEQKRNAIRKFLQEESEQTFQFDDDYFERFMQAKMWLEFEVKDSNIKYKLTSKIGGTIKYLLGKYKNYPYSQNEDFEGAAEWIMNKLSKKYSLSELSIGEK